MKWVLLAVVLQTPIKTDLVFDTLDDCLRAEHEMRTAWGNAYSAVHQGGQASAAEKKKNAEFVTKQATWGTCIPSRETTISFE